MRPIRTYGDPYIIAEISCNHMGSEANAHALVAAAAAAGADAVKFQLFTPDQMADPAGPPLATGPWAGRTLYDLYTEAMTPRAWFPGLFALAADLRLDAFASILHPDDVPFLEALGVPAYKIPSAEIGWPDLIAACAATDKPVILSTGMATLEEVQAAVQAAQPAPVILLHCVSAYPTPVAQANLTRLFKLELIPGVTAVGLSDHSLGSVVPVAATAVGAAVIEKHLMLAPIDFLRDGRGRVPLDVKFSLTPDAFTDMVRDVRATHQAMQSRDTDIEQDSRQFKRRNVNGRWLRAGPTANG